MWWPCLEEGSVVERALICSGGGGIGWDIEVACVYTRVSGGGVLLGWSKKAL